MLEARKSPPSLRVVPALLAFVFAFCAPSVFADNTEKEQSKSEQTKYSDFSLEELLQLSVVSASLYEQPITQAPASVTIITANQISNYGYRTLAEVLDGVAGFYINYDRNYYFSGIRGFGSTENTGLLVLIDGHRSNESIFGGSGLGRDFVLDLDLVDRVEVVRGPSSSIYGTNAFFAVVNVITKKGEQLDSVRLTGGGASYSSFSGQLDYGKKFDNGLDLIVSGAHYASDGQTLYFGEFDDPATNNGVTSNADDEQLNRFFAKATFGDFMFQGGYNSRQKGVPTAPWDTVFNDPRTQTVDERFYLSMTHKHSFQNRMQLTTLLTGSFFDHDSDWPYDYGEEGEPWVVVNRDTADDKWWGAEVQLSKQFSGEHRLLLGAEYRDHYQQDQSSFDEEIYLDDRRSSNVWALFVQDELPVLETLTLHLGLRFDHYDTFGGTTNPRLGLLYNPFDTTTLKLLYGKAFRAPTAYELFYHDGEYTTKANPQLQPEDIQTIEAIAEHSFSDRLRGRVSVYRYRTANMIAYQMDPVDGLMFFDNLDEVHTAGVEVSLANRWSRNIEAHGSYTFQGAEVQPDGEPKYNSPRHLIKGNFTLPIFQKILAGIEVRYSSPRKTVAGFDSDDFFLTNLTFRNNVWRDRVELSAKFYNLFDQNYGFPASSQHYQDIISMDGRNFRLRLSFRF